MGWTVWMALAALTAPAGTPVGEQTIIANVLRSHVSYLASDDLAGRDTGARGIAIAEKYIADSFRKHDGMPDVSFEGYKYFSFPMDHHEFIESGTIGNPLTATAEKGEEALRRYSEHVAKGILELMKVPVEVHDREFSDRV